MTQYLVSLRRDRLDTDSRLSPRVHSPDLQQQNTPINAAEGPVIGPSTTVYRPDFRLPVCTSAEQGPAGQGKGGAEGRAGGIQHQVRQFEQSRAENQLEAFDA